ncbi:MAG: N-acetyl-gamma-glutamyl-phosphate reductase [Armatimonadota bacterium]|nr:N-acetyl-gamma-glutamyl-phosphate reductase [Armatimonadota bacterium]
MRQRKFRVGIVGASGYAGGELVRLLLQHPDAQVTYLSSHTYAGKSLSAAFPGFAAYPLPTLEEFDAGRAAQKVDILFLAGESGFAMQVAPALLEAGVRVVDLSADFRLRDPAVYAQWYQREHSAIDLLDEAVYGLPELVPHSRLREARLVANPGCYPTAAALALAPVLAQGWVETESLVVDAKSGVSGAGRSKIALDYHFAELNESMRAYGVPNHRHTPEIEQMLSEVAGRTVGVTFTPHLIPITRGILCTAYAQLLRPLSAQDLTRYYRQFYQDKTFVVVREPGDFPATKHVAGTNYCHLSLTVDERRGRLVVVSVIDNLVKGAAGQAVQNMNLMFGLVESRGLEMPPIFP